MTDWGEIFLGPIQALLLLMFAVISALIAVIVYPVLKFIVWVVER